MKTRQQRRLEAIERQEERDKRTDQEQLKLIATRRGGSARETARLLDRNGQNVHA